MSLHQLMGGWNVGGGRWLPPHLKASDSPAHHLDLTSVGLADHYAGWFESIISLRYIIIILMRVVTGHL